MTGKFKVLRFIGTLYKVLGIITVMLTLLAGLGICVTSVVGGTALQRVVNEFGNSGPFFGGLEGALVGIFGSVFVLLNGGMVSAGLYAIGEGIYLMLSIEANMRAMVSQAEPGEPPRVS